uniref:Uncharacterized protein n=1 Tax=Acrobeloides nanus TaxID=290746 RepID=A0A914CRK5_9BILA
MEVIQKNFAKLLKDGDSVAERYAEKGKIPLTDRFHLLERGFCIKMKEDRRKTMFETACVRFTLPNDLKSSPAKPKPVKKNAKKTAEILEENKENIDSGRSSSQSNSTQVA